MNETHSRNRENSVGFSDHASNVPQDVSITIDEPPSPRIDSSLTRIPSGSTSNNQSNFTWNMNYSPTTMNPIVLKNDNLQNCLKLRKRFYPFKFTTLKLGTDIDLRTFSYKLRWSWKDSVIGGRINLFGDEVSLTKRFTVNERTALDMRVGVNVRTGRFGFGFDLLPNFGVIPRYQEPGLAFRKKIPIDRKGIVQIQAGGLIQLPFFNFTNSTPEGPTISHGPCTLDLRELHICLDLM
mmetsp:Transcript_8008/g.14530  ORF Transcript_8008/g.14530 Transcript_8008/m.14530 type:complete len:238 (+) Transcript_8008:160-873(+)